MEEIELRSVNGERVAFIGEPGIPIWHVVAGVRRLGNPRAVAARLSLSFADVQLALRYAAHHGKEISRALREHPGGQVPAFSKELPRLAVADSAATLAVGPDGRVREGPLTHASGPRSSSVGTTDFGRHPWPD